LVVDDEPAVRQLVCGLLDREGVASVEAQDGRSAMKQLAQAASAADLPADGTRAPRFDLIVTDLVMPAAGGLELLRFARRVQPGIPVIVLTGQGRVCDAVEAFGLGVSGFLEKPFDPDRLRVAVREALVRSLRGRDAARAGAGAPQRLLGDSPAMTALRAFVARAAPGDSTVLLLGESGTGKDVVAHELHRTGPRADGPFVAVHCGAIPEALVESELFGHARGAFTGAVAPRPGRFDAAVGGTLFLDEVGEMPLSAQVRLLRALETRTWEPVGGTQPHSGSFRVVAAINRDLEKAMAAGGFRRDLYYRLDVLTVRVPPLRERPGDVATLAAAFVEEQNRERGGRLLPPDAACLEELERHSWPGNVRELRHLVERAAVLKDGGPLTVEDLPESMRAGLAEGPGPACPNLARELQRYERELIRVALARARGNRNRASVLLGVNRTTLIEKIRRLGLQDEVPQRDPC